MLVRNFLYQKLHIMPIRMYSNIIRIADSENSNDLWNPLNL